MSSGILNPIVKGARTPPGRVVSGRPGVATGKVLVDQARYFVWSRSPGSIHMRWLLKPSSYRCVQHTLTPNDMSRRLPV
jgi:hypothetical protein